MTGQTLNAKQVADHIGVSRATLYNWINTDRFKVEPVPNSKPPRWAKASVDAWLEGKSTCDDAQPSLFDR